MEMSLFYQQYASIQPWLQRKDEINLGDKQLHQSVKERDSLVSFDPSFQGARTVSTSAFYVHAAARVALRTGGTLTSISDPPSSCRPTGAACSALEVQMDNRFER